MDIYKVSSKWSTEYVAARSVQESIKRYEMSLRGLSIERDMRRIIHVELLGELIGMESRSKKR